MSESSIRLVSIAILSVFEVGRFVYMKFPFFGPSVQVGVKTASVCKTDYLHRTKHNIVL